MPPKTDYTWDVFVSFRHLEGWTRWVEEHFMKRLCHWLGEELGREPEIYVDLEVRSAGDWPTALGCDLARSRVLVPLLSRLYFDSPWCRAEYELMRRRGDRCGRDLIVPAIIHDGNHLPDHARRWHAAELMWHANPWMAYGGPTGEQLAAIIKGWAPVVAAAIRNAPPYDPSWEREHVDVMDSTFVTSRQRSVPRWGR